jgi:uncharacterized repeat protein (TIGR01451 family)
VENNKSGKANLNLKGITLTDSLPEGSLFVSASQGGVYDNIKHPMN